MATSLLKCENLSKSFGGICAVDDLSFSINQNELLGLIGPNGAGKTTAFNMLSGFCSPDSGQLNFDGKNITKLPAHRISDLGMGRTFQNIRLFRKLSVLENIMIASHKETDFSVLSSFLNSGKTQIKQANFRRSCLEKLVFFNLADKAELAAGSLPYGEQRKLEIARALATHPKLLLLDEPAAGMNPKETADLMRLIYQIRSDLKISILLIEHDMKLVMGICERILVLDHGCLIADGAPKEIQQSKSVIEAYLGVEELS